LDFYEKIGNISKLSKMAKKEEADKLPNEQRYRTATLELAIIAHIKSINDSLVLIAEYAEAEWLCDVDWSLDKFQPSSAIKIAADGLTTVSDIRDRAMRKKDGS
jgi:hypothetical protein